MTKGDAVMAEWRVGNDRRERHEREEEGWLEASSNKLPAN